MSFMPSIIHPWCEITPRLVTQAIPEGIDAPTLVHQEMQVLLERPSIVCIPPTISTLLVPCVMPNLAYTEICLARRLHLSCCSCYCAHSQNAHRSAAQCPLLSLAELAVPGRRGNCRAGHQSTAWSGAAACLIPLPARPSAAGCCLESPSVLA